MRIIGLDIGDKTIGVAVSDPLGLTAQGITTIHRKGKEKDALELQKIISEYSAELILSGLPKNMNGTIGEQGEKVIRFCKFLEKRLKVKVIFRWKTNHCGSA